MINNKITDVNFFVDNYVNILDFKDLRLGTDNNDDDFYIAAIVGCIEGLIQIKKDKEYLTFINTYKIKLDSKYKFLYLYCFIKNNKKYYEYIVNYFNIWHGNNYDEFTYDAYNKKDLINNFYDLAAMLIEEREIAKNYNDNKVFEAYNFFCKNFISVN